MTEEIDELKDLEKVGENLESGRGDNNNANKIDGLNKRESSGQLEEFGDIQINPDSLKVLSLELKGADLSPEKSPRDEESVHDIHDIHESLSSIADKSEDLPPQTFEFPNQHSRPQNKIVLNSHAPTQKTEGNEENLPKISSPDQDGTYSIPDIPNIVASNEGTLARPVPVRPHHVRKSLISNSIMSRRQSSPDSRLFSGNDPLEIPDEFGSRRSSQAGEVLSVCYSPSVNSKNSCDDDASPDSKTEAKEGKPIPAWKRKIKAVLDNNIYTVFMTLVTIYALFGDDLRLLCTDKSYDTGFYVTTSAALFFFVVELVLSSLCKENYFLGFYFWLDIVSTLSLITDIGWIWDPIMGTSDVTSSGESAQKASQLARASRGARIGTKAGRIVRIIRLIRLIRIVKLYKHAHSAMAAKEGKLQEGEEEEEEVLDDNFLPDEQKEKADESSNVITKKNTMKDKEELDIIPEESKVGKMLSDLTTRRVIILVLTMMFSVPLFTLNTYEEANTSYIFGLQLIYKFHDDQDGPGYVTARNSYVDEHEDIRTPLLVLNMANEAFDYEKGDDPDFLRTNEKEIVSIDESYDYAAIFDLRQNTRLTAGLGICQTVFVCVVLAVGAMFFTKDANELVISPIEQMMQKVNRIAKNPLEAAHEEENEALALEEAKKDQEIEEKRKGFCKCGGKKKDKKEGPFETVILEQTIIKIGALLALGFGEAGARIIAENMKGAGGEVDPMSSGKKVMAIFGFCDIRNFTDTTEILQESVMVFVNEIAEIVHGIVDSYNGSANKNIGDAFLLVWKFHNDDVVEEDNHELKLKEENRVHQIADMSIISFLKIIAKINKSAKLFKYRNKKKLKKRMPNYRVRMGFGLHVGWAIEGAIGSNFKIDASYLSPNVNLASRLEAATKQFGVPLLISDALWDISTPKTQNLLRMIDTVTVKGSVEPMSLFTYDVDMDAFDDNIDKPERQNLTKNERKIRRVKARMRRNALRDSVYNNTFNINSLFDTDSELKKLREGYSPQFYECFQRGRDLYLEGRWVDAKIELDQMKKYIKGGDGPTKAILEFMEEHNLKHPAGWDRCRELTEK